ncbi:MAG: FIST C-terminal domain-containing protein [Alphaproteobacteria bacterium]|nr:FIST C-terminal domain-containing protein [Alphaproteobacteria bacterium]
MQWASALSTHPSLEAAVDEAAAQVRSALDEPPDLALVFVSARYAGALDRLPGWLREQLPDTKVVGCTGGGIIGDGKEREDTPALSITAARLPDTAILPFHLAENLPPARSGEVEVWRERFGVQPEHEPVFVLLPDPFTCDAQQLVDGMDAAWPRCPKVGGLASGGQRIGENRLFCGERALHLGVVGVALYGDVQMDTAVAQGCRPVGPLLTVTRCERNLIYELDDRPAVEAVQAVHDALTPMERALFRRSPMFGLAMVPADPPSHGDFLIRHVMGLDPKAGVLAIGAHPEEGQRVRFHVRDAAASAEDLRQVLRKAHQRARGASPQGALLFSCLGRGERFYDTPDHDSRVFTEELGAAPLGGFFCNGELGPVHARTWMHGYTSAFGLFHPRRWS